MFVTILMMPIYIGLTIAVGYIIIAGSLAVTTILFSLVVVVPCMWLRKQYHNYLMRKGIRVGIK